MKHYRIKVRDDKATFFEELLRYLDFLDYEQVEGFTEPRIYSNFELRARPDKEKKTDKSRESAFHSKYGGGGEESSGESLRDVLARIDKIRDQARKNK
ncbi:hypothetical protein [Marinilabilia sp.]|jgi:hypothetical protein